MGCSLSAAGTLLQRQDDDIPHLRCLKVRFSCFFLQERGDEAEPPEISVWGAVLQGELSVVCWKRRRSEERGWAGVQPQQDCRGNSMEMPVIALNQSCCQAVEGLDCILLEAEEVQWLNGNRNNISPNSLFT